MAAGGSVVRGSKDIVKDVEEGKLQASEIGYPVMIKASAGGGGRGMRIVKDESDFERLFNQAESEAIVCFDNG